MLEHRFQFQEFVLKKQDVQRRHSFLFSTKLKNCFSPASIIWYAIYTKILAILLVWTFQNKGHQITYDPNYFFFLEYAGELCIIALREEKGQNSHTKHPTHTDNHLTYSAPV
jgi:hypothetical protein